LEEHQILTTLQHGFRSGHSCETQLLITMEDLISNLDKGIQSDILILDFSKAFDCVHHGLLLHKLTNYGVTGKTQNWIKAFLTDRQQQVLVEGEKSRPAKVVSGVPQGTVLGPILFLLFINDIPLNVKSQIRLFADDCLLYRQITSLADQIQLQTDLTELENWAKRWKMRFNPTKCYLMSMSRSRNPFQYRYTLDGHVLEQVDTNPYLGVLLSRDGDWAPHIQKITKKSASTLGFLRRNLRHCNTELKETAYKSLVRSGLEYASTVWDPYEKGDITELDKIQRRAARFVFNDYSRYGSVETMLEVLNWESLEQRRKNSRLCMLFKILNGVVAIPADKHLTLNDRPARNRNSKTLKVYTWNTDYYGNSFFPHTVRDWNSLSEDSVSAQTIVQFKATLSPQPHY